MTTDSVVEKPQKKEGFQQKPTSPDTDLISLSKAASLTPYSQEYISLLARKGKLLAWKKGRNWFTTNQAVSDYLTKQAKEAQAEYKKKTAFTPEIAKTEPEIPAKELIKAFGDKIDSKLEGFRKEFAPVLEEVSSRVKQVVTQPIQLQDQPVPPDLIVRRRFHRSPLFYTILVLVALPLLFFGLSKGLADDLPYRLLAAFKNAWTLDGHRAGTHANEVLILNEAGNISIKGHIETQGQLRSYARDGVAPIIVDSTSKVENLNADLLDDFSSEQFTLAFVTNNGNITTDDVYLRGKVEVGQVLEVKGATRLLDELLVSGGLGVWGDAVFHNDVTIEGDLGVQGTVSLNNDLVTNGNDLILGQGTIKTENRELVENLNAELWNGLAS
ncbi:MAG: hypothetical protein ABIJ81_04290, partial [Patescibacteria group bacterium]